MLLKRNQRGSSKKMYTQINENGIWIVPSLGEQPQPKKKVWNCQSCGMSYDDVKDLQVSCGVLDCALLGFSSIDEKVGC